MLDMRDKIAIARAMSAMSRKLPQDSEENFLAWLRQASPDREGNQSLLGTRSGKRAE